MNVATPFAEAARQALALRTRYATATKKLLPRARERPSFATVACSAVTKGGSRGASALTAVRSKRSASMCDYSLHHVASRPAKVGDKLVSTKFTKSITRGFAAVGEPHVAVCL